MSDTITRFEQLRDEAKGREMEAAEERQRIVEQNGNDGLHYETPAHYNNEKGSLYRIAEERGWNAYQFDAIKRIDRVNKKGNFVEDIKKTIFVLELMLNNK